MEIEEVELSGIETDDMGSLSAADENTINGIATEETKVEGIGSQDELGRVFKKYQRVAKRAFRTGKIQGARQMKKRAGGSSAAGGNAKLIGTQFYNKNLDAMGRVLLSDVFLKEMPKEIIEKIKSGEIIPVETCIYSAVPSSQLNKVTIVSENTPGVTGVCNIVLGKIKAGKRLFVTQVDLFFMPDVPASGTLTNPLAIADWYQDAVLTSEMANGTITWQKNSQRVMDDQPIQDFTVVENKLSYNFSRPVPLKETDLNKVEIDVPVGLPLNSAVKVVLKGVQISLR